MELTKLTALELGAAIKRGEASVREAVQAALDAAEDIVWDLESVLYEPDTGYTHYEWSWEVL